MVNVISNAQITKKVFETRLCIDLQSGEGGEVVKKSVRVANIFQRIFGKSTKVILNNKVVHLNSNSLRRRLGPSFVESQNLTKSFQAALDSMSSTKVVVVPPRHDEPTLGSKHSIDIEIEPDCASIVSIDSFGSYKSCESLEDFMSPTECGTFSSPKPSRTQTSTRTPPIKAAEHVDDVRPIVRSHSRSSIGSITSSIILGRTPDKLSRCFDRNLSKFDKQSDLKPIKLPELQLTASEREELTSLFSDYNRLIKCGDSRLQRMTKKVTSVASRTVSVAKDSVKVAKEEKARLKRNVKKRAAILAWRNKGAITDAAYDLACTKTGSLEHTKKAVVKVATVGATLLAGAVARVVEKDDLMLEVAERTVDTYRAKESLKRDVREAQEESKRVAKVKAQELRTTQRSRIVNAQDAILRRIRELAA